VASRELVRYAFILFAGFGGYFDRRGCSIELGWPSRLIQFPGICYDYDPYDKFHLYGKYYPYKHEECRDRWLMRAHRAHKEKTHFARRARGESCIRSNIKNQRNACSG
jgi:hypothetical protein